MKKILGFLLVMILLTGCQDSDNISGYYEGEILINGQPLHIEANLDTTESLTGTLSIPLQRVKDIPIQEGEIDNNEVSFKITAGSQVGIFKGKYKDDAITGTFEQNSIVFDFALRKAEVKDTSNRTAVEINVDDIKLTGELIVPETEAEMPVALIIAGSGPTDLDGNAQGIYGNSYLLLAEALEEKGIATLRYNKRTVGNVIDESELTFEDFVNDAVLMIEHLKKDARFSEIVVIGHSQGGLIGQLASLETEVDKVVILSGAGRRIDQVLREQLSGQLQGDLLRSANTILESLSQGKEVTGVPESLQGLFRESVQPFYISWMAYDPLMILNQMETETLVVTGSSDLQVPVSDAERLETSSKEITFEVIDGMNHVLKDVGDNLEANYASYQNKDLPIHEVLVEVLNDFIQ